MKRYFYDADKYSEDIEIGAWKLYSDMCAMFSKRSVSMKEKNLVIERLMNCIRSFKSTAIKIVYDFYFSNMSIEQLSDAYGLDILDVKKRLLLGKSMLLRLQSTKKWFLIEERKQYLMDELHNMEKYAN